MIRAIGGCRSRSTWPREEGAAILCRQRAALTLSSSHVARSAIAKRERLRDCPRRRSRGRTGCAMTSKDAISEFDDRSSTARSRLARGRAPSPRSRRSRSCAVARRSCIVAATRRSRHRSVARVNGAEIRESDLALAEDDSAQNSAQMPPEAKRELAHRLHRPTSMLVAKAAEKQEPQRQRRLQAAARRFCATSC